MARILQVECDNPVCYNMIELADSEDFNYLEEVLAEFGWGIVDGEDYCPGCFGNEEEDKDYAN